MCVSAMPWAMQSRQVLGLIFVDSSVWVGYYNGTNSAADSRLAAMLGIVTF